MQSASAVAGLRHLGSSVPLIFMVGMLLVLLTNDMDKKHNEFQKALKQKRNSAKSQL